MDPWLISMMFDGVYLSIYSQHELQPGQCVDQTRVHFPQAHGLNRTFIIPENNQINLDTEVKSMFMASYMNQTRDAFLMKQQEQGGG